MARVVISLREVEKVKDLYRSVRVLREGSAKRVEYALRLGQYLDELPYGGVRTCATEMGMPYQTLFNYVGWYRESIVP